MPVTNEVAHDKEVTQETGFLDDAQFELQAVDDRFDCGRNRGLIQIVAADVRRLFFSVSSRWEPARVGCSALIGRQSLRIVHAFDNKFLSLGASMDAVALMQSLREELAQ